MRTVTRWGAVLTAGAVLILGSSLRAAEPVPTTITIEDIHCSGCAKRISARLAEVNGVATAKTDVKTKTAIVTPKPNVVLSPRALWEAVEKAGNQPSKLEGPSGTFTDKPPS